MKPECQHEWENVKIGIHAVNPKPGRICRLCQEVEEVELPTDPKEFVFGCCFCGEGITRGEEFQCVLVWPGDEEQMWWCHRNCFVEKLDPGFRVLRDEYERELLDAPPWAEESNAPPLC